MAAQFDLSKPNRTVHAGVILMAAETELLDVAPIDFLHGLSKSIMDSVPDAFAGPELKAQAIDLKIHWVSEAGSATPCRLTGNVSLNPTDSFETCPPLDIVLVGAHDFRYQPTAAELAFVRKSWETCSAFLSICGGIMVPLSVGILEGKTAAAPRFLLDSIRQQAPGVNWVEKRWVRDGKLWTSGALLNGTDMMNAFAAEYWGKDEGSIACQIGRMGGWPSRDVDYKDVPWKE